MSKLKAEADAHVSLKNERETTIENLFADHNLGSIPSGPLSNQLYLSFTTRLTRRMSELEMDLQEKKRSNKIETDTAWDCYKKAESHQKDLEATKKTKAEMKISILERTKKIAEEWIYLPWMKERGICNPRLKKRQTNLKREMLLKM